MIRIHNDDKDSQSFSLYDFRNIEAVSKVTEY